jgi:hypothetical protein
MRDWANQYKAFYGPISITAPIGGAVPALQIAGNLAQPALQWINNGGGGESAIGGAGVSALTDYAGNNNVVGTSSLAIGQTAAGVSTILARGAQALNIGNANGTISMAAGGATTISSGLTITASGLTISAGGASITGATTITDGTGTVWGSPTGGAQGANTINVAGGYFVNGVANGYGSYVKTKASATSRTTTTTPANDPDLNVALPGAGTYVARIVWWGGAVAAAGLAYNINYSGTFTAATSGWYALNIDASSVTSSTFVGIANIQSTVTGATAGQITASAQQGPFIIEIILVATGAGTLGMAWCQISSSASAATVENQSYMTVTRIA